MGTVWDIERLLDDRIHHVIEKLFLAMPNRLINETSPYLLQHAYNPVDWYAWGNDAFDKAKAQDKPILLSVGYSACHWCHVMEKESFENETIAQTMNKNFINIKVDREERPDIDSIYMRAVQAQTGRGGWPMTVFLTPDAKPFYGGTYFPPDDRHGMIGFSRLIEVMAEAYRTQKSEVTKSAEQLVAHLRSGVISNQGSEPITSETISRAYQNLVSEFDETYGGLGQAPKFPHPMAQEFLLRYYARSSDTQALAIVDFTLQNMAYGGIYDQIGGGFHRYSTDPFWLIPHFEKMLYDNALLARLYLHAYQITNNPLHRRIAEESLDYVLREMTDMDGGFYSTQDADSEGQEGKYFVWTLNEIENVLDKEEARIFAKYYGMTQQGNFDGNNILHIPNSHLTTANHLGIKQSELDITIQTARAKLLQHRQTRVPPARDEKILTAWNGMMMRSLAEAGAILCNERYLAAASANASFLLQNMRQERDGRLLRSYKNGKAKLNGYLEDYAFLIDGLIALHEATLDLKWLNEAHELTDAMINLFWDENEQSFFDTGHDHEDLIFRPRDVFDNATPSGGAIAAEVLLKLAILMGNQTYSRKATTTLGSLKGVMAQVPVGFGQWLCVLDFYLSTPKEIAVIGGLDNPDTQSLLNEVHNIYLPNKVITGYDPDNPHPIKGIPILENKYMVGKKPSAFVCQNYVCLTPVTEPADLANQLT
jgi:uncharacterized protein YyaL (SSP411 family)